MVKRWVTTKDGLRRDDTFGGYMLYADYARLLQIIEDAPHSSDCATQHNLGTSADWGCDCYKADIEAELER